MFTICPKCALTLLVTAEDLRVAQGYVRCGRCSSVFNALARLSEETQSLEGAPDTTPRTRPSSRGASPQEAPPPAASAAAAESSRQAGAPPPPPPDMGDEDSIPEDALEFDPKRADVSKVFVEPPANPQWSAATGTFRAMMAANQEAMPPPQEAQPVRSPASAPPRPTPPPAPPPPPPLPQASSAVDDDADIDVEIGHEQLAAILRAELAPVPPAAPSPSVAAAAPADTPARPRAPSSPARPPRNKPIEGPAAKDSGRPAAPAAARSAASAPPPLTPHQGPPPPGPPPAPAPARAAAPEEVAETPPAKPYARVLRLVRPGAGSGLAPYAWSAGAIVMLLALLAQIVHHNRDELAANPRFNRQLTAVYAALGLHLVPRWDLKAYDVRQLGAAVEPGSSGLITVRASVKNAAPQPQPLPLLRVTLQDRFGNRIAARDVAPRFYLPGAAPAFLSAGERIDAEMGFVDPGANAVGFEIDACLPASGGVITCANDSTAR